MRILRVLSLTDIQVGVRELASAAQLQRSGVSVACARLEDLGAIESVGQSRSRQYRLSTRYPFGGSIRALFVEERARAERIITQVRNAVSALRNDLRAAWLEGPVATQTDSPTDAVTVGALADSSTAALVRERLWERLLELQQAHDLTIELVVETAADLATCTHERAERLRGALPLLGSPPTAFLREDAVQRPADRSVSVATHAGGEAMRLRLAALIADRLARDPAIITRAIRHLDERLLAETSGERLALKEWRDLLLTMSVPRIRRLLVADSERSQRLRKSLPFLGEVSEAERLALLDGAPPVGSP